MSLRPAVSRALPRNDAASSAESAAYFGLTAETTPPRGKGLVRRAGCAGMEETYPGMPRWVKVIGLVVLGLLVAAVAFALLSGVEHGPARHLGP